MASCRIRKRKEEGKTFHKLHVIGMNDHLWDRVLGLGSETWKECELVELLVVLTSLNYFAVY